MNVSAPDCPACRIGMQEGFVLDEGNKGSQSVSRWTEGRPEKGFLGGIKTKGHRQVDIITFRCPKCGWLIWFAPDVSGKSE